MTQRYPAKASDRGVASRGWRAAAFLPGLLASSVLAGEVTLAWDPVVHASLLGYVLYYEPTAGNDMFPVGPNARAYRSSVDVGNTTTYTVRDLIEGAEYHFAVAAYDTIWIEGKLSESVSTLLPFAPPVAEFSASTTAGKAPLAMNFIDASTGTISSYAWTFGDGAASDARSPAHVYAAPGVYSVALLVRGPGGSSTRVKHNHVSVLAATDESPTADFGASTRYGAAPLAVRFASHSTGAITGYSWSFGDGNTSAAQNPSHVYTAPGTYAVSLTVIGPGAANTKTIDRYVVVSPTELARPAPKVAFPTGR